MLNMWDRTHSFTCTVQHQKALNNNITSNSKSSSKEKVEFNLQITTNFDLSTLKSLIGKDFAKSLN